MSEMDETQDEQDKKISQLKEELKKKKREIKDMLKVNIKDNHSSGRQTSYAEGRDPLSEEGKCATSQIFQGYCDQGSRLWAEKHELMTSLGLVRIIV